MAPAEFSEEWNSSCALRPASIRNDSEVNPAYFGFNWFIIVFTLVTINPALIAFYFLRKQYVYLRKRNVFAVFLMGFGTHMMLVPGPIRDLVGRQQFPCELMMWARVASVMFVPLPIVINLLYFRNQLEWSQALSKMSFQKLQLALNNNATNTNRILPRRTLAKDDAQRIVDISALQRVESEDSSTKIGSKATDPSSVNDDEFAKALKRRTFMQQAFAIFLPAAPSFIFGIILQFTLPYFRHECVGCYDPFYFALSVTLSIAALVVVILYNAYALRNEADPFNILVDLKNLFIYGPGMGGLGLVGYVIDEFIGRPYDRGIFSWDWLILLGSFVAFYFICVKPMYAAQKMSRQVRNQKIDFHSLLNNVQFRKIFTNHLVSEWSMENLSFYNQATSFKRHYGEFKTPKDAMSVAIQTYETYIKLGAVLQVNLPAVAREELDDFFEKMDAFELGSKKVPEDIFDRAQGEIFNLMEKDSFLRFQLTPQFQEFATENLVADPNRQMMVVATQL